MHVGLLCQLIGYLKTVEFITLKTYQLKKVDMLTPNSKP